MKKTITIAALLICLLGFGFHTEQIKANAESLKASADTTLAECYSPAVDLALAPAVVATINTAADLVALKKIERAATAIFTVDKELYITDASGVSMGYRPADIYEDYFKGRVIPAFCVKDMVVAEAVATYLENTFCPLDMAIVSESAQVIGFLKERIPRLRAIMDYSNEKIDPQQWDEVIFESNRLGAHAVILSAESASYEAVYYIQARNKTVWAVANGDFQTAQALSSGAYGIVTNNVSASYRVMEKMSQDGFLLNRTPYNVAHRGLAVTHYENSIEAFDAAYRAGATHIELDVQLTKDNVLVVMHSETIDGVTNGTGRVSDYTLEQLKQFRIIKNCKNEVLGDGVEIPSLEEVFEYFKDTDLLYVLEVKTGSAVFSEKLKALLDQCDMRNRMFIISFNEAQLALLRTVLPEISLCSLNDLTVNNFAGQLVRMAEKNFSFDVTYGNSANGRLYKMLKDRGYMVWTWTYGSYNDLVAGIKSGSGGLTNDAADSLSNHAKRAFVEKEYLVVDKFTQNADVSFLCYNNTLSTSIVKATAVAVEEHGNYAYVIYKARFTKDGLTYDLLTDAVRCVLRSAYISVEEMNLILSKSAQELSAQEITLLSGMEEAYLLLSASEQDLVDYDKIAVLKEAVADLPEKPQDEEGGGGCAASNGFSVSALLALGCFSAYCAMRRQRRKSK